MVQSMEHGPTHPIESAVHAHDRMLGDTYSRAEFVVWIGQGAPSIHVRGFRTIQLPARTRGRCGRRLQSEDAEVFGVGVLLADSFEGVGLGLTKDGEHRGDAVAQVERAACPEAPWPRRP